jgi:branched-chain amino acid transport system permease protein
MTFAFVAEQFLNGIQLGMILFLLAAGLTLIFGIMDLVNLAHGSLYMLGAYFVASLTDITGSFFLAIVISIPLMVCVGILLELVVVRTLYGRDHLDHVLGTFGLILFLRELVRLLWGAQGRTIFLPPALNFAVPLPFGIDYPLYRLLIIVLGLIVAGGLYAVVQKTRIGMLIRAGASNREMAGALGVNIPALFTIVFGLGTALAGFAGMVIVPITSATLNMGDGVLIQAFVVIVIGGIGSIRGAFVAALLTGLIDTMGRVFLNDLMSLFLPASGASAASPALSSMLIYLLMAAILYFRPEGLFPTKAAQ